MRDSEPYLVQEVDTAAVSVRESADFWAEHICRNQGTLQFRFADAATFHGVTAAQHYAGYQLIGFRSDGITYARTRADVRRDDDESLRVVVPTGGEMTFRQDDSSVRVLPGQAAVVTKARPFDFAQNHHAQGWVMNIPAGSLPLEIGAGPAVIDLRQGLGSVASGMIGELGRQRRVVDGLSFATTYDMAIELLKLCLRSGREVPTTLGAVDVAVRDHVRRHATDPELTPSAIAHHLGWSTRQVQLALQHTGTTPSRLIRAERLTHARRLLRESSPDRTVAEIAYASGFRSLSAFGAAFKAQFGLTPQEARNH
ncbi:AraC family transcriptional regulator [Nocardia macrotermitis]|uniref:HTH-type transcriptional activator RhaS n=1 Tax=Nocardia macrotermitis TaxID=2585198 RepID=A0A7K0DCN8_9NOCA|nr:AraC family transcriptional regulator [Nocardia macrotermitis]MQY23540.1 HTH-type transcriptional activator RhaS [Nocardia macrotermitis]